MTPWWLVGSYHEPRGPWWLVSYNLMPWVVHVFYEYVLVNIQIIGFQRRHKAVDHSLLKHGKDFPSLQRAGRKLGHACASLGMSFSNWRPIYYSLLSSVATLPWQGQQLSHTAPLVNPFPHKTGVMLLSVTANYQHIISLTQHSQDCWNMLYPFLEVFRYTWDQELLSSVTMDC